MDEKKIIKKYICPGSWMTVAAVVLALVLALTLVMGLTTLNADHGEPEEFYPLDSPVGSMAYIDVVGVSTWLFRDEDVTCYSVEDAEGYLYTVYLTDAQYDAMAEHQVYWDREDDSAAAPAPYRLEGYVQSVTADLRSTLADSWGISEEEYELYFGTLLLNATTTAGQEQSAIWFLGAMFSGIFMLVCLVFVIRSGVNAKKCLARLEERNLLEKAARELEFSEGHTVIGKNRAVLTQSFLFGKGTGVVVAYDDMLWVYQLDRRSNFVVASSYLMIGTAFMNPQGAIDLNRADRKGYLGDALSIISQRNPNALLGFSNENRKAYNAKVRG